MKTTEKPELKVVQPKPKKWREIPSPADAPSFDLAPGEIIEMTLDARRDHPTRFGPRGVYDVTLHEENGTDSPAIVWESAGLKHLVGHIGRRVKIERVEDSRNGNRTRKTYKVYVGE